MRHKIEKRGSKIIIWSGLIVYQEKPTESTIKLLLKLRTNHSIISIKLLHRFNSHCVVYNYQFYCKMEDPICTSKKEKVFKNLEINLTRNV